MVPVVPGAQGLIKIASGDNYHDGARQAVPEKLD
jgi:hypothetical protein